ncbi:MAG: helix-turn-helix transcriptional regulator [Flavobacteriales bacterium]|jgi:transcriptional regulator with XRE-family HTH domain|nr:helix-turn-helix transcriptional regulator [Flavobacteriales bacterium]MBT6013681.1 helix-turn-helix transcriptional regulator [Flavobacteriales bacterium]MBT7481616.1 helix-turn-helix transcriptional regulator [Flavobacteriales bacterium]
MHIRIKKWIESKELKSSSFADKIGVNRATISHVLSGRNKPSIDFLDKMIRAFPDLNSNWIVSGDGLMHKSDGVKEVVKSKNIKKIVVFYDDNSFEELNP